MTQIYIEIQGTSIVGNQKMEWRTFRNTWGQNYTSKYMVNQGYTQRNFF